MNKKLLYSIVLSGAIRYLLLISKYSQSIKDHVEVSTPLNSFKRLKEGVFLYDNGIDPYIGDIFHQNPIVLKSASFLMGTVGEYVSLIFIILDLLTAVFIFYGTRGICKKNYNKQKLEKSSYAEGTEEIQFNESDTNDVPFYCALAYLFNPYSILNCVGTTTTVWSNVILSIMVYALSKRWKLLCLFFLGLETQINFYPFILIVPIALAFSENSKSKNLSRLMTILLFAGIFGGQNYISYMIMGSWKFIDSTFGFIIHCRDLTPNIGLFWYFFTEMFDHFRQLFLYTFQLNTTILYLVPLTLTFKESPEFLLTILLSLITIFSSYPCVGAIAFYMSLIPLWKRVSPFMSHNFIVMTTFLVTSILGPTVYHLWMYANSANANFYFGVTLVFSTSQIFLLTDLCFAYLKRKFCLSHGVSFDKTMKLSLE
ncbi:phosphatidylinositol glycan anchor biosynthesis class U protein [Chironomus tepperi]|uniref:phosphatidylinositol glycan anchor biosynthesis class U protein n=1 Tax=Chironomus tepperi TaxID=113505 RepID=UPI00391F1469